MEAEELLKLISEVQEQKALQKRLTDQQSQLQALEQLLLSKKQQNVGERCTQENSLMTVQARLASDAFDGDDNEYSDDEDEDDAHHADHDDAELEQLAKQFLSALKSV